MQSQEVLFGSFKWINITEPDQQMVSLLEKDFKFHPLNLEDVLSKTTYPKIDTYKDYLFIILQFPVYEQKREIYKRSEISVFFSADYLITINDGYLGPLQAFFKHFSSDKVFRDKFTKIGPAMLFSEILDAHMDYCFPLVSQKNDAIFELEEEIYEKPELKDMIREIMTLKRDVINIRRILAPQKQILIDLGVKHPHFVHEEQKAYFEAIVDKQDKVMNQLDTAQAYVNVLEDANESLISRNTNKIVKTLTIFTVITQLPIIIAGYYGMNVSLPFQHSAHALTWVNLFMIFGTIAVIVYFKSKHWF
jgi:magnesium transporter